MHYRLARQHSISSPHHHAPQANRVRERVVQTFSKPTRTELATRRSLLASEEERSKDTWSPRRTVEGKDENQLKIEERTTFLPRYKVVLACMMAFVVCNMVCS